MSGVDRQRVRELITGGTFEVLGKGMSGRVLKLLLGNSVVAVKQYDCDGVAKDFKREMNILTQMAKHSNAHIIRLIEAYVDEAMDKQPLSVMEYAPCGSMYQLLFPRPTEAKWSYSIGLAVAWGEQVSSAVSFLHQLSLPDDNEKFLCGGTGKSKPVMHRDLKPANVLLFDQFRLVKVTDFGLARLDNSTSKSERTGTRIFMSPEILKGETDYTVQCDVYSFGVLLYQMLHRLNNSKRLRSAVLMETDKAHPLLKYLYILGCLDSPEQRPTMATFNQLLTEIVRRTPLQLVNAPVCNADCCLPPSDVELFTAGWCLDDVAKLWAAFGHSLP